MPNIQTKAAIHTLNTVPQTKPAAPQAAPEAAKQAPAHGSDTVVLSAQKKDSMAGLKAMAAEGARDGLIYGSAGGAIGGALLGYGSGKIIETFNGQSSAFGVFGAKGVAIAAGGGLVLGAVMGTISGTIQGGLAGAVTDINQKSAENKGMSTEQASNRMKTIGQVAGGAYGTYQGYKLASQVAPMISNPTAKAATAAAIVLGSAAISAWGGGATAQYINNKVGR